MIIYLIGMPWSGKTTLGKALANHLGWIFEDLDECYETVYGSIPEKIDNTFRENESDLLELITSHHCNHNAIISCGGGTPCYNDNIKFMRNHGTVIFVMAPLFCIFMRLLFSNKSHRRFSHNPFKLWFELLALYEIRERYYFMADFYIEGLTKSNIHLVPHFLGIPSPPGTHIETQFAF